jgi:acyl-CoA-dependent ceramide synthase
MYNCVVYSAWKDSARLIQPGCYTKGSFIPLSGQDTLARTFYKTFYLGSDVVCFTKPIQQAFIIFLVALQIITLIWLYMILRVAWRVVQGGVAEDTRSDDEDGDEENDVPEMEDFKKKQQLNRIVALDMDGKANGVAQVAAMNGPARQSGTFNSVMMNGHSRNHLSSQPLGGD